MTIKRFEELKNQIKSYNSSVADAEYKISDCESVVNRKKEYMRMGNGCILLGAIAVAVMLVLYFVKKESVYLYYAAACGFLLLIGVGRKIYGKIKYAKKVKSAFSAFKESALTEIKEASRYTGRDWDISKFAVTPENIAALEIDAEKFFLAVCCADYINMESSYSNDIDSLICDSWFGAFCFKDAKTLHAVHDPNTFKVVNSGKLAEWGKLDNILKQMEQSGSWRISMTAKMLRLGCIHIGSKILEMKDMGTVSDPTYEYVDLKRVFKGFDIQYTEPNNDSEREFFSICNSSASSIVYHLKWKVLEAYHL